MTYALGYEAEELMRLEKAAKLLHDTTLDWFVINSKSCLEIGCGPGSNLPMILNANPDIQYTGIDISPTAIAAAKKKYQQSKNISFYVMDAADIVINEKFDLIFCKLVLWSVGKKLETILKNVRSLLTQNGMFYALEPCNQFIEFYPPKPAARSWMQKWDEGAASHGHHPHIGIAIASKLMQAGFKDIDMQLTPVTAFGSDREKYLAIVENFKGFFMGQAAVQFGINHESEAKFKALAELEEFTSESLVMDCLCASWGFY